MRSFHIRGIAAALISSALVACAHANEAGPISSFSTVTPAMRSSDALRLLTGTELRARASTRSLYDAVSMLRPTFVRFRGARPGVIVDGVGYGSIESLNHISVESVDTIRLLSGPEATLRYGPRHTGAILVVTTRRR